MSTITLRKKPILNSGEILSKLKLKKELKEQVILIVHE
jgi:hypothetical protein